MPDNDETTRIPDGSEETTRILGDSPAPPASEVPAAEQTWSGPWQQAWDEDPDEQDRGRRTHPLQTGYLVIGLLALGVALMWLLTDRGVVEVGDGGVAFSVVLITAGAVGLVASFAKGLRRG